MNAYKNILKWYEIRVETFILAKMHLLLSNRIYSVFFAKFYAFCYIKILTLLCVKLLYYWYNSLSFLHLTLTNKLKYMQQSRIS